MNTQYLKSLERLINLAQSRMEQSTRNAASFRERLIRDFSCEDGPGWNSDSSVFSHVINSAKAKAYEDLIRLLTNIVSGSITHEAALADLEHAINLAKDRLMVAKDEIVQVLKAGLTPTDQIGWSAHQARIETLREFHNTLKVNTPEDFNE